jgi:regulator of replication initiation timing
LSKNTRGDKEYTRLQTALNENRKLKRENASLRKALSKLDLDRHAYVRDIVEEHYAMEDNNATMEAIESSKSFWKCRECHEGHLEIIEYPKMGVDHYYRKCNNCKHRTKSQRMTSDVKGPRKPKEEIPK